MSRIVLRVDRISALIAAQSRSAAALRDCTARMSDVPGCAGLASEVRAWAERTGDLADRIATATRRTVAADADAALTLGESAAALTPHASATATARIPDRS